MAWSLLPIQVSAVVLAAACSQMEVIIRSLLLTPAVGHSAVPELIFTGCGRAGILFWFILRSIPATQTIYILPKCGLLYGPHLCALQYYHSRVTVNGIRPVILDPVPILWDFASGQAPIYIFNGGDNSGASNSSNITIQNLDLAYDTDNGFWVCQEYISMAAPISPLVKCECMAWNWS